MNIRWHQARDLDDWLDRAVHFVRRAEARAIAERGVFHVVLAGGDTPRRLYTALAQQGHDWARWQVWFGDERCRPPEDPVRNSRMALEAGFGRVPLPPENFHVIPAERGAEAAARAYAETLAEVGPFDLVLLGLGEDGHTASLFPGRDWGEGPEAPDTLAVYDAPKPPPERVSLSARRLAKARAVLFLVTGASKRRALAAWRRGERIPAAAVRPAAGVDVLLDPEAGG